MNRQQRRAAARAGRAAPASAVRPDLHAQVRHLRAQHGPDEQAIAAAAERVLAARSDDVVARLALAEARLALRERDRAMLEARRGLRQRADHPYPHELVGRILMAQDRIVEAIAAFERAVSIAPHRASALQGLGSALVDAGLFADAMVQATSVVRRRPDDPAGYVNLMAAQLGAGDFAGVVVTADRAARRGLRFPGLDWNRALGLLGLGELGAGWDAYEAGFPAGTRLPDRELDLPRWSGDDLAGRRLLVWREQGLGDEVRFASCLPDVVGRAAHVVLEASPRLVSLLARSFPDVEVRAEGSVDPSPEPVDLHCPIGSLPRQLRRAPADFPGRPGYLVADDRERRRFRDRLARLGPGPKVGLCWRSLNLTTRRLGHYATLEELLPLLQLPGIEFVNLQYGPAGPRETELQRLEADHGIVIHRWSDLDYTDDLEAVAGLTAELDLVVGPSSFPVVLAGALGVPARMFHAPSIWTHGTRSQDLWWPGTRHLVRPVDQPWELTITAIADELAAGTRIDRSAHVA